jgi:hypothetical protein
LSTRSFASATLGHGVSLFNATSPPFHRYC